MVRLLACVVALLTFAGAAAAETRAMCFEPGTATVSSDGYTAVRETVSALGEMPPFKAHIVVNVPGGSGAKGLDAARLREAQLEIGRLGVTFGAIRVSDGSASADCLGLELDPTSYLALWHYYGPYFEANSSDIAVGVRESLRFIVATHEPGVSKVCVEGHADTAEADPDRISRERADNVARELIRHGIPDADIHTRAYGASQLARARSNGPEPLNRRVSVHQRGVCRFDY